MGRGCIYSKNLRFVRIKRENKGSAGKKKIRIPDLTRANHGYIFSPEFK
jgi:hypothetical protein